MMGFSYAAEPDAFDAEEVKLLMELADDFAYGIISLRESAERRRAEEALSRSQRELNIRNQVADIFLAMPDDEIYGGVLAVILKAMESRFGVFGYINEQGALVCPSMSRDIWDQCQVPDKDIVFPRDK